MSAVQALSYLRERGVAVEVDGGDLVLSGADDLSAKTIERLREIKAEIVTLLQAEAAEAFLAAIQTIWPEARMLTPEEQAEDAQFREQMILLREANAKVYAIRTPWKVK
jgi:hypothetical protein